MRESDLTRANQRSLPTSRRLGLGIMAVFGIVSLFVAACTSPAGSKAAGQAGAAAGAPSASPAAQVTITPANGTGNAKPNKGISVTATTGKITNVTVTTGHQEVGGVLATDAKSWHTNWSLHTGAHYKVTVSAINAANKITTTTSSFRTLAAGRDVLGQHDRGPQPDLRRRHADHDPVQLAGHPQGGGGEGDPDQDLQAGRGRLDAGTATRPWPSGPRATGPRTPR